MTLRPLTVRKVAAGRAARGGTLLKALLGVSALLLALAPSMARADGGEQEGDHNFQLCPKGDYALCAASTCTPALNNDGTQKKIKVNDPDGGFKYFPQVDCLCPVFTGVALADVNGGNMQGSCDPPVPPLPQTTPIWSLFSIQSDIPQASNNWDPPLPATPQICPAKLNLGDKSVNCFSFACDTEMPKGPAGVPVVTCHCAQGESFNAQNVPAHTAFAIQSATKVKDGICRQYPIALPFTLE